MSKRGPIRRDWTDARRKVDDEGRCRGCKKPAGRCRLEAAHTLGREYDERRVCNRCGGTGHPAHRPQGQCTKCNGVGVVRWVNPDDIMPLCGPATDTSTCHGLDHANRLNKLALMTTEEQVRAVQVVGTIGRAYVLLGGPLPQTTEEAEQAATLAAGRRGTLGEGGLPYPPTPPPGSTP